jgi:hypothetical protein
MTTPTARPKARQASRLAVLLAILASLLLLQQRPAQVAAPTSLPDSTSVSEDDDDDEEGNASTGLVQTANDARAVVAAFTSRSYRPGSVATLRLARPYPGLRVELLHVGPSVE